MAISDISLTAGMRSNLLSLQNTVTLLDRTQTRLATGKKVNSAIDNATSFFAAQSLNSRASTIDSLKDAMGQAVSTIKAADKGISAITSLIEQAKGIAQQALSAEISAGFDTETVEINGLTNGDSITVGGVELTAGPTEVVTSYDSFSVTIGSTIADGDTVQVGGATFTAVESAVETTYNEYTLNLANDTLEAGDIVTVGGVDYTAVDAAVSTTYDSFTVDFTGIEVGDQITIDGAGAAVTYTAVGTTAGMTATDFYVGASGSEDVALAATNLKAAVDANQAGDFAIADDGLGELTVYAGSESLAAGLVASADVAVTTNTTTAAVVPGADEFIITGVATTDAANLLAAMQALQGSGSGGAYFTFAIDGDDATKINITAGAVELDASTISVTASATTSVLVTSDVSTAYAALADGEFRINSGDESTIALALQAAIEAQLGAAAFNISEDAGVLTIEAGSLDLTATSAVAGDASIAVTSESTTAYGPLADDEFMVTGDDVTDAQSLANAINSAAITGYSATANGGVVTIENSEADIAAGSVTVSSTTAMVEEIVAGTSELTDLIDQFNTVRIQIDELAEDSGYKGKNLLSATAGLRSLDVKFEGATLTVNGFNATTAADGLNVSSALTGTGTTWTNGVAEIDASIDQLDAALTTLRQESSKMSGNLSIISVRQDFSTNMINTLTEGSDKLTAADSNEEGANMLMLQTRQSLSTTALSLSAQAAQSVLKLFG